MGAYLSTDCTSGLLSNQAPPAAEDILAIAVRAARAGEAALHEALDGLETPIYTTAADGRITYYNPACIVLAGRTPTVGEDRWCVTWKLYNERGTSIPHEQCPMAVAIREKRAVRGVEAVAERPDGSRINFRPYPTPILDETGAILGAVNMLIDVTERKQASHLLAQAAKCRRLATCISDERTVTTLTSLAADYEEQARRFPQLN
jgi:PAS domain S-box-containing protein